MAVCQLHNNFIHKLAGFLQEIIVNIFSIVCWHMYVSIISPEKEYSWNLFKVKGIMITHVDILARISIKPIDR